MSKDIQKLHLCFFGCSLSCCSETLAIYFLRILGKAHIGIQINFVDIAPFVASTRPVYDRFIGNLIPQQAFDDVMRFLNNVRN